MKTLSRDLSIQEKNLILAKLLNGILLVGEPQLKPNINIEYDDCMEHTITIRYGTDDYQDFEPYDPYYKDQFAAIILAFPDAMLSVSKVFTDKPSVETKVGAYNNDIDGWDAVTQTTLLDEVIYMYSDTLEAK